MKAVQRQPEPPFERPELNKKEALPENFDGFIQLSVAKRKGGDLKDVDFSLCRECESLIVYRQNWIDMPKVCKKCYRSL